MFHERIWPKCCPLDIHMIYNIPTAGHSKRTENASIFHTSDCIDAIYHYMDLTVRVDYPKGVANTSIHQSPIRTVLIQNSINTRYLSLSVTNFSAYCWKQSNTCCNSIQEADTLRYISCPDNTYCISYHIISYRIISYYIVPYHTVSYCVIKYHIVSYRITGCMVKVNNAVILVAVLCNLKTF